MVYLMQGLWIAHPAIWCFFVYLPKDHDMHINEIPQEGRTQCCSAFHGDGEARDKPVDRTQLPFITAFIIGCHTVPLPRVNTARISILVSISVLAI